ncbi:MAG: ankyrin repeat domain-containing protein [Betaproteobacteria bacterium]|nr:ankyrin repeat domain-containing protein [Betaproteobacteria bacterium]
MSDPGAILLEAVRMRAEPDVVRGLLRAGADIEHRGSREDGNFRPVHMAARWADEESSELLQVLLQQGANPNAVARGGQTPLLVALGSPRWQFKEELIPVTCLLAEGADPNLANCLGHTPLMYAASMTPGAVSLLLNAGADSDAADNHGWRATDWAMVSGRALDYPGAMLALESERIDRETPRYLSWNDNWRPHVLPAAPGAMADYLDAGYPLLEYPAQEGLPAAEGTLTDGT